MMLKGVLFSSSVQQPLLKKRLAGCVTVNSVGALKRVVVLKRETLEYFSSTHSNADGSWEIRGMPVLPERSLLVEIIDDTGNFDPITFDNVSQVE